MDVIEYEGKILRDGHLSCPDDVKKHLALTVGSAVKVAISPLKEGRITKIKGVWADIKITDEDIREAREEMWGRIEAGL